MIAVYSEDIVEKHARPDETKSRLNRVLDYFPHSTLGELNADSCSAM